MLIYKFDYIRNIVYNQAKDKQKHTDFPQIGFPNIRIFLASTHCKPSFPKQPAVCAHPFSRKQLSSAKKGNPPSASCSHVSRWGVLFFHRAIARDRGKPNGFSRLPHCGAVARGQKSSIIANDPGAKNLVDRLRRLLDYEKNDFVMSDIPGCGVGALDHVYFKLNAEYHGEFDLAPFTVVADWRPT